MNNLKRVLSLALSGIMLVGMMAMGASAAEFSDAEKIEHDDAVNVLVSLSVINGKDDGSFDPQGNVTRAEMAKMIAVAMNGGKDTNTGTKTNPTFTDIKGHWAESYIEYCYDMGIISGRGDGTFDPGANVTGLEATKMVLTALGYDSQAYKLTGASWAVRTDELAKQADPKLYEELGDVVMANNASRDTAAQLIWNGLQNWTKRVTPQQNTNTGEVTFVYGDGSGTLLKERYNADIVYGTYYGNHNTDDKAEKGEIIVAYDRVVTSKAPDGKETTSTEEAYYYVPSGLDISNIGEEVKVIYKEGKDSRVTGPDRKDTIYGVFVTGKTEVVHAIRGDVKDNNSTKEQIKIGDTKYDLASTVTVWENYVGDGQKYTATDKTYTTVGADDDSNSKLTDDLKGKAGSPIKLVMNRDGEVARVYITTSVLARVTAKNSEKVTLNNGVGTLTIADHDVYDGIKKDDIVVVTALYDSKAEDGYATVVKAEPVSGTVSAYKDTTNVTMDGTTYKLLGGAKLAPLGIEDEQEEFKGKIGEDFDLYLVDGYVAAAAQTSESNSNYSLVTEVSDDDDVAGGVLKGAKIQVMGADGTKTVLTLSKDCTKVTSVKDGKEETEDITKASEIALGDIVTYSVNKDGTADVKVEASAKAAESAKTLYVKKTKSFDDKTTSSDCVLFVDLDKHDPAVGDEFKAYSIRDLNDVKVAKSDKVTVVEKDGEVVAVFMALADKPSGATSTTLYGIVSAYKGTEKVDGTVYNSFTVDVNDEQYQVYCKNDVLAPTSDTEGTLVQLEVTADSIYTGSELKKIAEEKDKVVAGYVTKYSENDGTITVADKVQAVKDEKGNTSYEVAEDAKSVVYAFDKDTEFYYVDKDDNKGVVGTVAEFDAIQGKKNIIVILDTDKVTATQVIFETSNKADILGAAAPTEKVTIGTITAPTTKDNAVYSVTAGAGEVTVGEEFTVTINCTTAPDNTTDGEVVTITYGSTEETLTFKATGEQSVKFTAVKGVTDVTAEVK